MRIILRLIIRCVVLINKKKNKREIEIFLKFIGKKFNMFFLVKYMVFFIKCNLELNNFYFFMVNVKFYIDFFNLLK